MKTNMGKTDRAIRFLVAALVVVLYITETISGTLGIVLMIVSGIFLITSFIGFCPLYAAFGLRTKSLKLNTDKEDTLGSTESEMT